MCLVLIIPEVSAVESAMHDLLREELPPWLCFIRAY